MRRNTVRRRPPLIRIAVIITALITLVLFGAALNRIRESSRGYSYYYKESNYAYPAASGRFGELYETALSDMMEDAKYSDEVKEYRALAFYYENAVLAHAYRECGDDTKSTHFEDKMKLYETALGSQAVKAAAVRGCVDQ